MIPVEVTLDPKSAQVFAVYPLKPSVGQKVYLRVKEPQMLDYETGDRMFDVKVSSQF